MEKNPKCDSVLMKSGNYITVCVALMVLQKMGNSKFLPVVGDFKLFCNISTHVCDPSVTDSEAFNFLACYKLFCPYW